MSSSREIAPVLTQMEFHSTIKMNQVSSLHKGNYLIRHAHNTLVDVQDGILIGSQNKGFQMITETQWRQFSWRRY